MKPGFYDKSKRTNVYNSIFIYKMVSLIILGVLTIILAFLYHRDKEIFHQISETLRMHTLREMKAQRELLMLLYTELLSTSVPIQLSWAA